MDFTVYVLHCWAMLNVCMLSSRDSSTRCALKCAVRLLRRRLTSVLGPRPPPCSTETFFLHHFPFARTGSSFGISFFASQCPMPEILETFLPAARNEHAGLHFTWALLEEKEEEVWRGTFCE